MRIYCLVFSFFTLNYTFGQEVRKLDLNKDQVIDRFEYYQKEKLIRIEEDINNDKKIDFITIYDDIKYSKIEIQDTNFNGKFDRKILEENLGKGKIKITTKIDKNNDSKYEIVFSEIKNTMQKQEHTVGCYKQLIYNQLSSLIKDSIDISSSLNNGFLLTGFGYKIDKNCLNKWGVDFPLLVKESISTGLQCFLDLNENKSSNITWSLRNAQKLTEMMKEDKTALICSEENYEWSGTAGRASTSVNDSLDNPSINHPFISINPKDPTSAKNSQNQADERNELKKTIFHEQLHNLGFRHGDSIEFPYACEDCCFAKESDSEYDTEKKNAACKICKGDYTNNTDKQYLEDLVSFSRFNYSTSFAKKNNIRKYLKENPGDNFGISLLAHSTSDAFNPIGAKLADIIKVRNSNLDIKSLNLLEKASEYRFEGVKSSGIIAEVYYELYFAKNGAKAIEIFERNKEIIKLEINALKNHSNKEYQYIGDSLYDSLDSIVYDLWVNEYGDSGNGEISTKAYELSKAFEGLK